MSELCAQPALLAGWLEQYGSPLNVIDPRPMARNATDLAAAAAAHDVPLEIFFARKANKALAVVDEANRLGLGVDVASERELRQTLDRGVSPERVVATAAIKPRGLMELCVAQRVTVVVDNFDELDLLLGIAGGGPVSVALRLNPVLSADAPPSRFGFPFAAALEAAARVPVAGVHFHLGGYAASDRVAAITESLRLIDALRERGHSPGFLDIGGGIPMSYVDSAAEWQRFWSEHHSAPATFDDHPLANVYPYHQRPVRGEWLGNVLQPVSGAITARALTLRCEPGRSLLDGCGMTVAQVRFRKPRGDGAWLIGVEMNRSQCRSGSDDFLVDPLLLRPDPEAPSTGPIEGYLVGAYCIERELLTWRRLCFPDGVSVGDLVVFPNTAGYLMHLMESSSHQIPLAQNVIVTDRRAPVLDE
jgi:diaminopimelate decarboxylase